MSVQVIMRDGAPEYAVLPWDEYQALLNARGQREPAPAAAGKAVVLPSFGELSAMRQAKGISQEALARSVGISPVYMALIESGERDPGDAIRRALARAMEIEGWEPEA